VIGHASGFGPPDAPDAGEGACCIGAAVYGPERCTCWEPVHDLEQATPDPELVQWLAAGIQPVTRRRMCADCAYRPGSPERTGDKGYQGDAESLHELAAAGERFWCHQGIRRTAAWRHPAGVEAPGSPAAYDPPIVDAVPYRADGTPAELCAGWDARRRAIASGERSIRHLMQEIAR
jgi:hypothetical protein